MSEMCCTRLAENTGRKTRQKFAIRAPLHNFIRLYMFATKACVDNRKQNLLSSNISYTCPHNMMDFGALTPVICWRVWGTPANFNRFRVLASLSAATSLNRNQPTFGRCVAVSWAGTLRRAPAIFGRTAITLGIGPHSSFILFFHQDLC